MVFFLEWIWDSQFGICLHFNYDTESKLQVTSAGTTFGLAMELTLDPEGQGNMEDRQGFKVAIQNLGQLNKMM